MQYENAQAVLYCGITNESDNHAKLGGTEGEILLHGFWHNAQKVSLTQSGNTIQKDFPSTGIGYIPEIEEVNRCIASGKRESELWRHSDALPLGRREEEVLEEQHNVLKENILPRKEMKEMLRSFEYFGNKGVCC